MREKEVRLVVKKRVCVFKPRKGTASLQAWWFGAHPPLVPGHIWQSSVL